MRSHPRLGLVVLYMLLIPTLTSYQAEAIESLVRIYPLNDGQARALASMNLDIASFKRDRWVDVIVDEQELVMLESFGYISKVLVEDMDGEFARRFGDKDELGAYHTYQEMIDEMNALAATYPDLVQVVAIGETCQGRTIWAAKVSDNVTIDEGEPNVLCIGNHHAREMVTPEIPLHYLNWLLDNYGTDAEATFIVDNRMVWIVPCGNPDGHIYVEEGHSSWRKNRRLNSDGSRGVDLNRNFGYMWGYDDQGSSPIPSSDTFRGTAPFSEPEAVAVKNLAESRHIVTSINYHSYGEQILIPPGYASGVYPPEPYYSTLMDLASQMAAQNGYEYGIAWDIMYLSNGRHDDWLVFDTTNKQRTFALEPEVGNEFWPPESQIEPICQENLFGNILMSKMGGPLISFLEYEIIDIEGDNDRRVDPGESVQMKITANNRGLGTANNPQLTLLSESEYVEIDNNTTWFFAIPFLGKGSTQQPYVSFTVSPQAPLGTIIEFACVITCPGLDPFIKTVNVEVTDLGYRQIYAWNLDQVPSGWSSLGTQWQFGEPLGGGGEFNGYPDPPSAYSGDNVYATNLAGDYAPNSISWLTTESLDLRGVSDLELRYRRWLNVEGGGNDTAIIEAFNGIAWEEVWRSSLQITENQWNLITHRLPASLQNKQGVKLRFKLTTNATKQYSGWNMDDIAIVGLAPPSANTPTPTFTPTSTGTASINTATPSPTIDPSITHTPLASLTPSPTPSTQPTYTHTPTSTPYTQPTPPAILLAGYWDTRLSSTWGGKLIIIAYVQVGTYDIEQVRLYYGGAPLDITLNDEGLMGDIAAGDNIYTVAYPMIPAGTPQLCLLIEFLARDAIGLYSPRFPFLTCPD